VVVLRAVATVNWISTTGKKPARPCAAKYAPVWNRIRYVPGSTGPGGVSVRRRPSSSVAPAPIGCQAPPSPARSSSIAMPRPGGRRRCRGRGW
jgi:hypothetical protein